jgi:hypothetical protein
MSGFDLPVTEGIGGGGLQVSARSPPTATCSSCTRPQRRSPAARRMAQIDTTGGRCVLDTNLAGLPPMVGGGPLITVTSADNSYFVVVTAAAATGLGQRHCVAFPIDTATSDVEPRSHATSTAHGVAVTETAVYVSRHFRYQSRRLPASSGQRHPEFGGASPRRRARRQWVPRHAGGARPGHGTALRGTGARHCSARSLEAVPSAARRHRRSVIAAGRSVITASSTSTTSRRPSQTWIDLPFEGSTVSAQRVSP